MIKTPYENNSEELNIIAIQSDNKSRSVLH